MCSNICCVSKTISFVMAEETKQFLCADMVYVCRPEHILCILVTMEDMYTCNSVLS